MRLELAVSVNSLPNRLDYWVDLPADYAPATVPANATLLLLFPLACHFREDIHLEVPVDGTLVENLDGVQQIWRSWYPRLGGVRIEAPIAARHKRYAPKQTLASFSGGVDSFFTLLRHRDEITHLMSVAGFNTPMEDVRQMRESLAPIASRFGKRHVQVLTNIRYGSQTPTPYSVPELMVGYAHGCLLAGLAHLMEDQFDTYVIPASHQYAHLMPYGSHPFTDPLFSSGSLRVIHDGASFDRVRRTELITTSPEALSALHVCWQDFRRGNCSTCQKCLRTMATLDLLGSRKQATGFDWSVYTLDRIASAWLPTDSERAFFEEVATAARTRGRLDLADVVGTAIERSVRRARRLDAVAKATTTLRRVVNSNRLTKQCWTATRPIRAGLRNAWLGARSG